MPTLDDVYDHYFSHSHFVPIPHGGQSSEDGYCFGFGKEDADIVIVGEKPGEYEFQEAKPFSGRTGEILSSIMEENGISWDETYRTNLFKHDPVGDRFDAWELKFVLPYLKYELEIIKPKLVIVIGSRTAKAFFPGLKFHELVGRFTPYGDYTLFVMHNPSYLAYAPNDEGRYRDCFRLIREFVDKNDGVQGVTSSA